MLISALSANNTNLESMKYKGGRKSCERVRCSGDTPRARGVASGRERRRPAVLIVALRTENTVCAKTENVAGVDLIY